MVKEKGWNILSKFYNFWLVGQFKDDCLQQHKHILWIRSQSGTSDTPNVGGGNGSVSISGYDTGNVTTQGRTDTTTHGKQKGVKYIIKVL